MCGIDRSAMEDSREIEPGEARSERIGLLARGLIGLVRLYQIVLGPIMGGHCKYAPTCSHYALAALREHGALRGSVLTVWRVLRCNPFSSGGLDPVPPRKHRSARHA